MLAFSLLLLSPISREWSRVTTPLQTNQNRYLKPLGTLHLKLNLGYSLNECTGCMFTGIHSVISPAIYGIKSWSYSIGENSMVISWSRFSSLCFSRFSSIALRRNSSSSSSIAYDQSSSPPYSSICSWFVSI